MAENHQINRPQYNNSIKNSGLDPQRYIEWGISNPNPNPNPNDLPTNIKKYPFNTSEQPKGGYEVVEDGQQYHTQYSQVSAIETGFKKLKTNQIDILKELRRQYQVLRSSSLQSRVFIQKQVSESQSNQDFVSQSDLSSLNSKQKSNKGNKELRLANLQKKQLELMLNNSMRKIQQLLYSQIQLKKQLLDMKSKLDTTKSSESDYDLLIRRNRDNEQNLQKTIDEYRRQNETLRNRVKELILNIGNLQGTLGVKELQLKKKEQRYRLLQQQIHLQHNKYSSLQLDLKKIKMEYDMLQKAKNQEISMIQKNRNNLGDLASNQLNQTIRRLKQELQVKQQRYLLLLNRFTNIQQPQQNYQQKLKQSTKDESNRQNNESITLILNKITQLQQKPDNHLLSQINNLRHQLSILKQTTINTTNTTSLPITPYETKIRQLQRIIQQENIEKIYFMEDLKKLTKDYTLIKKEREDLSRQVKDLREQNRKYRNQLESIKSINIDLTQSQHQNKNLITKLQHMNLRELQVGNIKEESARRVEELKSREQTYEDEIRTYKRRLHEEQFKVFKERQENQLKIKLLKLQYENQVNLLQTELQKTKKNSANEKNDLINQKIQIQKKLLDLNKQIQDLNDKTNTKNKDGSLQRVRAQQQFLLKRQQQKHSMQISGLISKIQSLTLANERILQYSQKYALIQQESLELKRLVRANRKLTDSVDHLWQVKEAEYGNIDQILKQCIDA